MKWKNIPSNIKQYSSFVYKIEFDDGTFYIGYKKYWKYVIKVPMEKYIESNWKKYNTSSKYVKNKIKKYKGNIAYIILENHQSMFDSLISEQNNIKRYRKLYPSLILNLTDGYTTSYDMEIARRKGLSRSNTGKQRSTESIEKQKQYWKDPEFYKKGCERNLAISKNPETISKLKKYRDNVSPERKQEISKRRIETRSKNHPNHTEIHKNKISESIIQYYIDNPEKRNEKSITMKKVLSNMEIRTKISNSNKGKIFTEEHKLKLSLSAKGKQKSDEHKKKLSEATIKQQKEIYDSLPYLFQIDDIKYKTYKDATDDTGMAFVTIKKRLNDIKYPTYKWL